MKTLKLILAWLDWSTYAGINDVYNFPKSLCSLFWRTLISIVTLPATWVGHIWNLLVVKKRYFYQEEGKDIHKFHIFVSVIVQVLLIVSGAFVYEKTDGKNGTGGWGWDWFHWDDPFLFTYIKMLGAGVLGAIVLLIFIAVCILAIVGVYYVFKFIGKLFAGDIKVGGETIHADERLIPRIVDAVKNKYCPTMDWSAIKKKSNS